MKKSLFLILALFGLMSCAVGQTTTTLTFKKQNPGPTSVVPDANTALFVNGQGQLVVRNGLTNTIVGTGTGSGGSSGQITSTVWPPENITNPVEGMYALGPVLTGSNASDSLYQRAIYMKTGPNTYRWDKYIVSTKRNFP